MPYKFETDKKKLPKELDRRIKLTNEDREEIIKLISSWLSDSKIGSMFWVSRKTIYFIRNPEQLLKNKQDYKIRRSDWRYYSKQKQTEAIQKTRIYKKENIKSLI